MEKFESKIGPVSFIILTVVCFITVIAFSLMVATGIWAFALICAVLLLGLFVPCFFFTYYKLDENTLYVRSGWFKKTIKLDTVISVTPTKNYDVAPALSSHRIKIEYMENDKVSSILISPVLFTTFLQNIGDYVLDHTLKNSNKPSTQQQTEIKVEPDNLKYELNEHAIQPENEIEAEPKETETKSKARKTAKPKTSTKAKTTAKTKSQSKSKTTRTIKEEPAKEIQVEKPTDSEKPKTKQTKTATKTKAETKANKTTIKKITPASKTTKTSAGKKEKSTEK